MKTNEEIGTPDRGIGRIAGKRTLAAVLLFAGSMGLYLGNGRGYFALDSFGIRHLAVSLLREQNLDLDEFKGLHLEKSLPWGFQRVDGKVYTVYPFGPAVCAAPIYVGLRPAGWHFSGPDLLFMEKFSASLVVATANVLFFFLALRFLSFLPALLLTLGYSFGTINVVLSSQALWQHGFVQLFLILFLLASTPRKMTPLLAGLAGFALGMMYFCRPAVAIVIPPMILWFAVRHRGNRPALAILLAAAAIPFVVVHIVNLILFHSFLGIYYDFVKSYDVLNYRFSLNAFLCYLVSPGLGLFFYSPFLILALPGLAVYAVGRKWENRDAILTTALCAVSLAIYIVYYSCYGCWWGGSAVFWGPRFLSDILPFACLLLVPFLNSLFKQWAWKSVFLLFLGVACFVNLVGAYSYQPFYGTALRLDPTHETLLWKVSKSPIAYALRHGRVLSVTDPSIQPLPLNQVFSMSQLVANGNLDRCFHGTEPWGAWSAHSYSRFFLKSATPPTSIAVAMFPKGPAEVRLILNGELLRQINVPLRNFRMQVYPAHVPEGLWKPGETNVLLVHSTLRNPYAADAPDQRATFVAFSGLRLNR